MNINKVKRKIIFIGGQSAGRDNHFNVIRMIAASCVLISHAYPITLGPKAIQPLETWLHGLTLGTISVYVFFAISGFFITKSFDRSSSLRRFLLARALRIYPALTVVLLLTLAISGLFLTTAPTAQFWPAGAEYLWRNLSLARLQYELPGVFEENPYGPAINGSLWTLFYEVACYIAVVIVGILGLLRHRVFLLVILLSIGALQVIAPTLQLHSKLDTFIDLAFPFAIGAAFYIWRNQIPLRPSFGLGLAVLTLLASVTPLFQTVFAITLSYWVFLIGLAKMPPLLAYNRLGDYSYGLYIYAFPVQQLAAWFGVSTALGNMALSFPITLACAILSWHLIEKPALTLVRRPLAQKSPS